ncbi:MAG: T9SS type A sorting domain-containing protein, partial [Flavobacterium sp.]|nr:T9SS type A sorting domain-containing protein [Flavobacterium sp.]
LLPFESREMTVNMQVPNIPTVTIGGLLTNTASIVPLTGDVVPTNNSTTNTQIIIGAYDPNDKMEAHGEQILHSTFNADDYLTYTIRFENTGTVSAINVRVNDVLDADLDESTIRMVSASHPYIMDRVGSNVNWIFDDIQLPPSVADTNIGKGYITFQIKPTAGYAVGDIIPNTASIYFDFNPAIVTNTFNTEFVQQLGVGEFENANFVFYPNPVNDIVTIQVKNEGTIANIAVYDVSGKIIMAQKSTTVLSVQTLDLSSVSKGMYLLEVTTDTNLKVVKKLIVE